MMGPIQSLEKGKTPAMGKAYAFFYAECGASSIRYELNKLKADPDTNIPKNLQVFTYTINEMHRNKMVANNERELVVLSAAWLKKGANYFMKTFLPYATNHEVAVTMNRMFDFMTLNNSVIALDRSIVIEIYFRDERGKFVAKSETTATCNAYVEPVNAWRRG